MNYKKVIDNKISELKESRKKLEKDYDGLLRNLTNKGIRTVDHDNYIRVLNNTFNEITKIDGEIKLLIEIKERAR